MRSPFKFLDSYEAEDARIFFGREKEEEALVEMIFKTPLLLIYGMSGTGKTSLVQCGLARRFDGPHWLPLYIRRRENVNDSLREAVGEVWPADEERPEALAEQIELLYSYYLRPVYLIFDQFEELFILSRPDENQPYEDTEEGVFTAGLKALLDSGVPCKVILVMREEFIGALYRMEQRIPTIYDYRLRVEPMGRQQVKDEVLRRSFDAFNIGLDHPDENLELICDQVSGRRSGIELPYLQIYLDRLYQDDFRRTYPALKEPGAPPEPIVLEKAEIEAFGDMDAVLGRFLVDTERELTGLLNEQYPGQPANSVRLALDAFVTPQGTKRPVRYRQLDPNDEKQVAPLGEDARGFPQLPAGALTLILARLLENRLLRPREGRLELAHDSLAALIDTRRSDREREVNELFTRIDLAEANFAGSGDHLGAGTLGRIEELRADLAPKLEKRHQAFIQKSRARLDEDLERERARRKEAEEQRALAIGNAEEAERQKERALDQERVAKDQERKARRQSRIALGAFLLALLLAGAAGTSYLQAKKAEAIAMEAEAEAIKNLERAREAEEEARENLQEAERQKDATEVQKQIATAKAEEAERATDAAQTALTNLQGATASIFTRTMQDVDQHIRQLDYETALEKLLAAASLNIDNRMVGVRLLEIAYVYTETGQAARAAGVLDTVAQLLRAPPHSILDMAGRIELRKEARKMAPVAFEMLEARYYPEMVLVEGGTFIMGSDTLAENRVYASIYEPEETFDEFPRHQVQLDDYYISKTETTVWQFYIYCQSTGRDIFDFTPPWGLWGDHPVVNVNWYDALSFANWLSERQSLEKVYKLKTFSNDSMTIQADIQAEFGKEIVSLDSAWLVDSVLRERFGTYWEELDEAGFYYDKYVISRLNFKSEKIVAFPKKPNDLDDKGVDWQNAPNWSANGYRLPTEAEWEYAARGGRKSRGFLYSGSDSLDLVAWWGSNCTVNGVGQTHPVALKLPNELGLYDMTGNALEYCWDVYRKRYYQQFENKIANNPTGPLFDSFQFGSDDRVARGGAWKDSIDPDYRLSERINDYTAFYDGQSEKGFRLSRSK